MSIGMETEMTDRNDPYTEKNTLGGEELVHATRSANELLRSALHVISKVSDVDLAPSEWSAQVGDVLTLLDRTGQLLDHYGRRFGRLCETEPGLETDEMLAQPAPLACRMAVVQLAAARVNLNKARDAVEAAYQKTEHLRVGTTLFD